MDARTILIRPVISEKSYALISEGKYTFRVDDRAHKTQIAQAVEEVFGVSVAVLDATAFETPSTKAAATALGKWGARRPTLVVLDGEETGALKSFRNIDRVTVAEVGAIGVADAIGAASLVISEKALEALVERLG